MKEFIIDNLDVLVTIIGFIITYKMTTMAVGDEIRKSKISHNAEMIHALPLELCEFMGKIQKHGNNDARLKDYEKIMSKILAYGSRDAVNIAVEVQQASYRTAKTGEDVGQTLLVLVSLLITQLKYDISEEIMSPESWFKMKINDYENVRVKVVSVTIEFIIKFGLNDAFYIEK